MAREELDTERLLREGLPLDDEGYHNYRAGTICICKAPKDAFYIVCDTCAEWLSQHVALWQAYVLMAEAIAIINFGLLTTMIHRQKELGLL